MYTRIAESYLTHLNVHFTDVLTLIQSHIDQFTLVVHKRNSQTNTEHPVN